MSSTLHSHRGWHRAVAGFSSLSLLLASLSGAGCATTRYVPDVVARGEITLRYDNGFELQAGRQKLTHGLTYPGLAQYVRCVPEAARHARAAQQNGRGAVALSILGGVIGVSGLGGLYGLYDQQNLWPWLLSGVALGAIGTTLAGLSYRLKNHANGHAVDAVNYYNDSVGSLGATCDDLRYPEPAGPGPSPGEYPVPALPPPPLAPAP
jgi:hypothetical protein